MVAFVAPVGEVVLAAYVTAVGHPAIMVFCTSRLPGMLASVGAPFEASTNKPCGHPIMSELKIEIVEFLLICAPAKNKLLPVFANVAFGPRMVIFEKIALVCGVKVLPFAS